MLPAHAMMHTKKQIDGFVPFDLNPRSSAGLILLGSQVRSLARLPSAIAPSPPTHHCRLRASYPAVRTIRPAPATIRRAGKSGRAGSCHGAEAFSPISNWTEALDPAHQARNARVLATQTSETGRLFSYLAGIARRPHADTSTTTRSRRLPRRPRHHAAAGRPPRGPPSPRPGFLLRVGSRFPPPGSVPGQSSPPLRLPPFSALTISPKTNLLISFQIAASAYAAASRGSVPSSRPFSTALNYVSTPRIRSPRVCLICLVVEV